MSNHYLWMQKKELQNRNFGLDLIRCLAILMVLTSHTLLAFYNIPSLSAITFYLGILGVDLFFVLSGFLIGTILIKIHSKQVKTTFSDIKGFWIRRWFRTLPNYFLILIVYLVFFRLYSLYIPYHKLPLYFVFLQNTFSTNAWFYGVSWSLSVEEWFYLLFPLCILFVQRFVLKSKQKVILYTVFCFLVACLSLRICVSLYAHKGWDEGFRKQMPLRLDSIAVGVLAAAIKVYSKDFWFNYKNKIILTGACFFVILSTILYFNILKSNVIYATFFMNTLFFTLMSLTIAMFIPYAYSLKATAFNFIRYIIT
jgi:peptidoglycan/LPS O-acetylase OafA/YrhL